MADRKGGTTEGGGTWVIVNENAGTVRTMGKEAARQAIERGFEQAGQAVRIDFLEGGAIEAKIGEAVNSRATDTIIVGGGDGTVSSAGRKLAGTGKVLGVIPLGTMNLFAKALGMPNGLDEAVKALTTARPVPIDAGRINGRVFLHHVSLGLHPRMARIRERFGYGSRLGKIVNSVRALVITIWRPPKLRLDAAIDTRRQRLRSPAVVVSNNLFGQGHLPYPDKLDDGVLGIYVLNTFRKRDIFRLASGLLTADWEASPYVDVQTAEKLDIASLTSGWTHRRKILASIDGELEYVTAPLHIEIWPKALVVLAAREKPNY